VVVTLWYRAPEILLGSKDYGFPIDMWALGCVLAELMLHRPFFPGKDEMSQIRSIFSILGYPSHSSWPGWTKLPMYEQLAAKATLILSNQGNRIGSIISHIPAEGIDMLNGLLTYAPEKRATASIVLQHDYLTRVSPRPTLLLPTFPSTFSGS